MSDSDSRRSIKVHGGIWKRLNARKEPGDSFNDVIEKLLDETE
jgi:predicted CopG family antitoxin